VAAFSSHLECLALLLAKGASFTIVNNSNLTARQEAKGTAMDVFAIFEAEVSLTLVSNDNFTEYILIKCSINNIGS
jgi:hypothetical protein